MIALKIHLIIPCKSNAAAAAAAKSLQSCPTLCDPKDGSPPGSPIPGILQARTQEWVAISFSYAWKWKVKVKLLSRIWLPATPWTEAHQAPLSMGFSRQEYWSRVPLPSPKVSQWPLMLKKKKKLKKILGECCFGKIYINLHPDNWFSVCVSIFSLSHTLVPLRVSKIQNCLVLLSLALWLGEKNERPVPDKGMFEASVSLGQMSLSQVQHWRHQRGVSNVSLVVNTSCLLVARKD